MRCFASPTTCIADAVPRASAGPPAVASTFATLLVEMAFRPLARPLGFFGDVAIEACARAVARDTSLGESLR
jgi:hypothetical protein